MPGMFIQNPLARSQKAYKLRDEIPISQRRLETASLLLNFPERLFDISSETPSHPLVTSQPLPRWRGSRRWVHSAC